MKVPTQCNMPDLSDLDSLLGVLMLSLMLPGDEKLPPKTRLYRRNEDFTLLLRITNSWHVYGGNLSESKYNHLTVPWLSVFD
jgi:hypothetical protein